MPTRLRYAGPPGEVSEWPKERDWKSRTCRKVGRGFESLPLRLQRGPAPSPTRGPKQVSSAGDRLTEDPTRGRGAEGVLAPAVEDGHTRPVGPEKLGGTGTAVLAVVEVRVRRRGEASEAVAEGACALAEPAELELGGLAGGVVRAQRNRTGRAAERDRQPVQLEHGRLCPARRDRR